MTPASRGLRSRGLGLLLIMLSSVPLFAGSLASDRLTILGASLEVETTAATAGIGLPTSIQTIFSGQKNELAPVVPDLVAVGELTGPGLDEPVRMTTAPGHAFQIPGLPAEGVYTLQNIRLLRAGEFVQYASPPVATITVADVFQTSLKVRRLTPEEMRARGIMLDATNYEVYEYTFQFVVNGEVIEVPYPVIIDTRTREIIIPDEEKKYVLPVPEQTKVPRWDPPRVYEKELVPKNVEDLPPAPQSPNELDPRPARPSIPAAIVIPNEFAVLHQFFSVIVAVSNGAPNGSNVVLDSVTAHLATEPGLRLKQTEPAVSFGSAVPIVDAENGVTFLVAQASGEAEYILEALDSGLHAIDVEINATYQVPGQADIPLRAEQRASIMVHDPRFNITFSHPDTIRDGIEYSTHTFVTNMSPSPQTIRLSTGIPICPATLGNVCQPVGSPEYHERTLDAGATGIIEYRLVPSITGHVFATAGSVSDDSISAAVELSMGVSATGLPLSPATLIMPWYARYVDSTVVDDYRRFLGLGYGLATAPLNNATAKFPRVTRGDIFRRAVDIAGAGHQSFIGENELDALAGLSLDMLGNQIPLAEYDELRRQEATAATAAATLTGRIATAAVAEGLDHAALVRRYAESTLWRQSHLLAIGYATAGTTEPFSLAVEGRESGGIASGTNLEETTTRTLPFADINAIDLQNGQYAEMAQSGMWAEDYDVVVTPHVTGFVDLEIVYPDAAGEALLARFTVSGTAGEPIRITVIAGSSLLEARDSSGVIVATAISEKVSAPALDILGVRQDLHKDQGGHKVSVLFNRPVGVADGVDLLGLFSGSVSLQTTGIDYNGERPISAAAIQEGSRIVDLTFDHSLHVNASYTLETGGFIDPILGGEPLFAPAPIAIDNDRPAAIIFGQVLAGSGEPIPGSQVRLNTKDGVQYDTARDPDAAFLFEYVPKDIDAGYDGSFGLRAVTPEKKGTSFDGAVRLPGRVTIVNLTFLGRGSAQGYVRYDDGSAVPGAAITIGSTMFDQFRSTTADQNGFYSVVDLPVGPLTFTARDDDGNVTHAARELTAPGEVLEQNLEIFRQPFPETGTVRGVILRSDDLTPVAGARVGVYTQGFGLVDGYTGTDGRFSFEDVPSGFITVLASEWSISRQSIGVDFDLAPGETRDVELILQIADTELASRVEGIVYREDLEHLGDASFYQPVASALVQIEGMQVVTADANGRFAYDAVPTSLGGRTVSAWDPVTQRIGKTLVPTLTSGETSSVSILVPAVQSEGRGTLRIRLLDAWNQPVSGYRVIEPGFPPLVLDPAVAGEPGVYEIPDAKLNRRYDIWAVPPRTWNTNDPADAGPYGDQFVKGSATLEFDGQILTKVLRLPGEGTVDVSLKADIDLIGDVEMRYQAWDEASQSTRTKYRSASTEVNGLAGAARFEKVPASIGYSVSSLHPTYGYAAASGRLEYQNDSRAHQLQLSTLSSVEGYVYAIDGITPIAGATVRLSDGRTDQGSQITAPDGSFRFDAVGPGTSFIVMAEHTQNGTYRVGRANGSTPSNGGPVSGVSIVMKRQGQVEGRVVYEAYKVFDPLDSSNNVPDDTPEDLSDNAPVPLAKFHLRELSYPFRTFGSSSAPLTTDEAGAFYIGNLFEGGLRVSGWDSGNQELRGDWSGVITTEGEKLRPIIAIGDGGVGEVSVEVVDPNDLYAPVANVEVTLRIGSSSTGRAFDVGTTNGAGEVIVSQVPEGIYNVTAYSKALGRFGESGAFEVVAFGIATPRVQLEFSGIVRGDVVDPEASYAAVGGAGVTLRADNYSSLASTDSTGRFEFNGVREGTVKLSTKDTDSNRRASATRTVSKESPEVEVRLELEQTRSLFVEAYLPADDGSSSGQLVPSVEVTVTQRGGDYHRTLQGNPLEFPGMFLDEPYSVVLTELGGEQRKEKRTASFPTGDETSPLQIVLDAYGDVETTVIRSGMPAEGVQVKAGSKVTYTDSNGLATLRDFLLGQTISVQATSLDGQFSAAASTVVTSQTIPARVTLELGDYAAISGYVEAEAGGPSVGTRVVGSWSGGSIESRTGSDGRFTLVGIPATSGGLSVALAYIGPDDTTIGARQTVIVTTSSTSSNPLEVAAVKLDATPPAIISIYPQDGAQNVSPDSRMKVVFSEALDPSRINSSHFDLRRVNGGSVGTTISSYLTPSGEFVVEIAPNPVSGQPFPLASNTLYTLVVSESVADLAGLTLGSTWAVIFRTTDYTEPRVLEVLPDPAQPVYASTTFEVRFSEPVDAEAFSATGSITLQKIDQPGDAGAVVATIPGTGFLNPEATSLFFGPSVELEPESFYRLSFSGIADEDGNALAPQTIHFYSWDATPPYVTLASPNGTDPLVAGVQYLLTPEIRNGSATGELSTDIERVDWYRVDSDTPVYQISASASPYSYTFVAPANVSTMKVRAIAFDFSGNESNTADLELQVIANAAPANVAVALTPQTESYANRPVDAAVSFDDEGLLVSVNLDVTGTRTDGTAWTETFTSEVKRASTSDAWTTASFPVVLPGDLQESSSVSFTATVTDSTGQASNASSQLAILDDALAPLVYTLLPAAETRYAHGDTFEIEATVSDAETGVRAVIFRWDGNEREVLADSASAGSDSGTLIFRSGSITVPVRNADTRVVISATAEDHGGNSETASHEIIWTGVNDPTVPSASWSCPVDRAVVPAGLSMPLTLRVFATDDIELTSVDFEVAGQGTFAATRVGTSDLFEATPTIVMPASGETLSVTALVNDADPTHLVELPITLEAVTVDQEISGVVAVSPTNAASFGNQTLLVRGPGSELVLTAPLSLANLIVLEGGSVRTTVVPVTPAPGADHRVDLTIAGSLYVDCSSSIDVSEQGYLAGWGVDATGARNEDRRGRTAGNTTEGGSTASASHGGYGSIADEVATNETYGSITQPLLPGAGGAGRETCCTAGGAGGGAIALDVSGVAALSGAIRADGGTGTGRWSAGAGGSISLHSSAIVFGHEALISASGGDDEGADRAVRGAGGGRIAVIATTRYDLPSSLDSRVSPLVSAHGGRNGGSAEGTSRMDGGAGTVWLQLPGATNGELLVSSFDPRHPSSAHSTRPTSIAEPLIVDRLTVGPRALVRVDSTITAAQQAIDPSAIVLDPSAYPTGSITTLPADGSSIIQDSAVAMTWSAASQAGITRAAILWSLADGTLVDWTTSWPIEVVDRGYSLAVPFDATVGPATLQVRFVDRAERVLESAVHTYDVVENTAPVISAVTVDPSTLAIYPGNPVSVTVGAVDDVAVASITLTSTLEGATDTWTRMPGTATASEIFSIPIPPTATSGSVLTIDIEVSDAYPNRAATTDSVAVSILEDTNPPAVQILEPTENQQFLESSTGGVPVRASVTDAEVGVIEVTATVETNTVVLSRVGTTDEFTGTVPFPPVSGETPVPFDVVVVANDYAGNAGSAVQPILIEPFNSPDAPVLTWTCGGAGAMYPAGFQATLKLHILGNATGDTLNGVETAELRYTDPATGVETIVPMTTAGADIWEGPITVPSLPDGQTFELRAIATNVAGLSNDTITTITVVQPDLTITNDVTIGDGDNTYENQTIAVTSGTLALNGGHTFGRLFVYEGASLSVQPGSVIAVSDVMFSSCNSIVTVDGVLNPKSAAVGGKVTHTAGLESGLELNVTGILEIRPGGSIDVSGKGYAPDQTHPSESVQAGYDRGGSHMGRGGGRYSD
ncbi:MAG: Ig-like domain-containing protein, partial [Acidobacteria bacterium]|nr:Ig-like domain-containing protein [Acidobacteriota bacterium]